jgi:uncharacterized protein (TIGR02246 family)
MKTLLIAALSILLMLSTACSTAQQESSAPSPAGPAAQAAPGTAEVREAQTARMNALATGDVEAYLSVYMDDAVWMPPGATEIVGKEAARARITQAFDAATLEPVFDPQEQTVMSPEWIADRGHYPVMVTPKAGGEGRQEVGFYLTIWRRDAEGRWKIHFDIWNTNRPVVDFGQAK